LKKEGAGGYLPAPVSTVNIFITLLRHVIALLGFDLRVRIEKDGKLLVKYYFTLIPRNTARMWRSKGMRRGNSITYLVTACPSKTCLQESLGKFLTKKSLLFQIERGICGKAANRVVSTIIMKKG